MKRTTLYILTTFLMNVLYCQNIVSNGSFEEFSKCPKELGDFFSLSWYSIASNSSPDLFSICAPENGSANPNWYYSGVKPFKDSSFVGIILGNKKTTYREYLGTRLSNKLKKDSVYIFKISVAIPVSSRYQTNTLDIIISEKSIFGLDGYTIIENTPSIKIVLDNLRTDGMWTTYSFEYIAKGNECNLSIGNFKSKKQTVLKEIKGRNKGVYKTIYNSAYICLDDIQLFKNDNINETTKEDDFKEKEITSEAIVISGIIFKTGSSKIENNQISDLEKITNLMLNNKEISIEINGYTDNIGNEAKNIKLSKERANSVKKYFVQKGILESRIKIFGKGSENPIANNETNEGRIQNRRIEIVIK